MRNKEISVSAPGRICLFGEHQDYLGLPIIAGAINLRISIRGSLRKDRQINISLSDLNKEKNFLLDLDKELTYSSKRDYLISAINVLRRSGISLPNGLDCCIHGTIPINSGTASSSALVVAWIKYLLEAAKEKNDQHPETIAKLAFLSEVAEFKEPGGKMDHYTSSLGGIICIHFDRKIKVKRLKNSLKEFVLADSLQRKDTTCTLAAIKKNVFDAIEIVRKKIKDYNLKSPLNSEIREEIEKLPSLQKKLLKGTIMTRDLTAEGEALFKSDEFDHVRFGKLLTSQQDILRDYLQISTPKINRMIETSLEAEALGAKINGSGEGGCIFAYTPEKAEQVAEALRKLDTKAYIVQIDDGVRRNA